MLSDETLEGGLEVMRKSFFIDENVCIAVELYKYPKAAKELEALCVRAAKDGASIVAIDKKTNQVIGAAFNKMQIKGNPEDSHYFETFASTLKEPASKSLVMFMKEADESYNLFEKCDVDCLLEIMFLATLKEYRGKGIAKKLCEATIMLGKTLLAGDNIKESISNEPVELEPRPKMTSAIFTSYISQKIGSTLGFQLAIALDFNRWSFDGKTYGERIGPLTPKTTLEYLRL
nr:uncharacterized protein LOC111425466 isoform X2 [Onthophagus taurus]